MMKFLTTKPSKKNASKSINMENVNTIMIQKGMIKGLSLMADNDEIVSGFETSEEAEKFKLDFIGFINNGDIRNAQLMVDKKL